MEPPGPDAFFDASDELPSPEPDQPPVSSTTSYLGPAGDAADEGIGHSPQTPPASLRRRRSSSRSSAHPRRSPAGSEASSPRVERRGKGLLAAKGHAGGGAESASSAVISERVAAVGDDEGREVSAAQAESSGGGLEASPPSPSGLLVSIAGLVIKAIGFQMSLLVSSVTFPLWLLHCSFLLVTDPFQTLKRGRDHVSRTLIWFCTVLRDTVAPLVFERLSTQRGIGKWVLRVAVGCFWAFYVGLSLLVCLFSALVIGRLLMGSVVEEPLRFTEELSFDYTKASPIATVPILSCHAVECGLDCSKSVDVGKLGRQRLIPPNHKVQVTVSLTLPESEYNQKLGVFQIRIEIFSADGKNIASSSRPCMLQFKSPSVQFLRTLFKSGPLLAGYSSETQTLNLKMQGFTEGSEPTACIRITLARRAEYRAGAGLPEIYSAYIRLESELPLFKKFIWNWRRTLFVWISIGLFNSELVFILICCAPLIIPGSRHRSGSSPGRSS